MRNVIRKNILRLTCILVLIGSFRVIAVSGANRGPDERRAESRLNSPPLANLSPKLISVLTLGHRSLYEDFLVIWLIQILADQNLRTYATAETLSQSIMPAMNQKPRLESIYMYACFILALDFNEPKYCEPISLIGIKTFPNSWRIPVTQAFIHNFLFGSKAKAAVYYGIAAQKEGVPLYIKNLALRLAQDPQSTTIDLNETLNLFKEVPEGTKLLQLLKPILQKSIPKSMEENSDGQNALPSLNEKEETP